MLALFMAALCVSPTDRDAALEMIDFLKGPRPLSALDKQFLKDRFMDGKDYMGPSYFAGAVPANDYTPANFELHERIASGFAANGIRTA